jgi:hypothetical protein
MTINYVNKKINRVAILQALLQRSNNSHTRRALEQTKYCSMDVSFKLSCSVFCKPFFISRTPFNLLLAQRAVEMYCNFITFQECISYLGQVQYMNVYLNMGQREYSLCPLFPFYTNSNEQELRHTIDESYVK